MQNNIKNKLKQIPHKPGCYRYFDKNGRLIYIGKAKDLKKRVYSYFVGANDPKTTVLVENIADIEWEITESEIEALVLESLLIKKFKPKFNIKVKDDKDFLWVKIDFKKDFPYPELIRRPDVGAGFAPAQTGRPQGSPLRKTKMFGPFTDPKLLKEGLSVLRKIFLWRDCSESKFSFYQRKNKPCLEYYIKNCPAPCLISDKLVSSKPQSGSFGAVSIRNDYQLGIRQLILFLKGGKKRLINDFERQMKVFSKKKEFEKAAIYRDRLRSLQNIDANLKINKIEANNREKDLESFIDRINLDLGYNLEQKKNFRIEFYDISNISGREATGSMVVWQGDHFYKNEYRKFKIKFIKGPNDVGMMREVLWRRIRKISNYKLQITNKFQISNSKFQNKNPDLIVLDGGKPQLGEIWRLFQQLSVKIPLISLAKSEEEVFGIKDGRFKKTSIEKNSPEGYFIQLIRDEAHRFAIGYHKNLRAKKMVKSRLDEIEGIGPVFKKKLLLKFGSVSGIIKADIDDVVGVVGKKLAQKIKESL